MLSGPAPVAESLHHDYFQPSGMCRRLPFAATGVVGGASAPWDMRSSGHFIQLGGSLKRLFDLLALYGHSECLSMDALSERSEEHTSELQSRGHRVCRLP